MTRVRVVEADPSLPHQIRLVRMKNRTVIKCNCRKGILGVMAPNQDPMVIYNKPERHNNKVVPFVVGVQEVKVFDVD